MTATEVLQWATRIAFGALAAVATREWLRTRHRSAAWLSATFLVLAAVVVLGLVVPDDPEGAGAEVLTRGVVIILLLFPYLLYRFAGSFGPDGQTGSRAAAFATGAVVVATVALPDFPSEGETQPPWFTAYVVLVLLVWVALSVAVARRLWRAGSREPRLARRRMRLLGAAGLFLAAGLVISGAGGGAENDTVTAVTQLAALISAVLFLAGYSPPAALRLWWRRPEVERLRRAELELMEAGDPQEILDILLPRAAELVGARDVTFEPFGHVANDVPDVDRSDVVTIPLSTGRLVARTSPYAPLFGDEERRLLEALGVVADLALERARLFVAEREARRDAERSNAELEQFAYAASHDLQSPLAVVAGYTDLLRERHADALGDAAGHLDMMSRTIDGMQALINDLLELSRIGHSEHDLEELSLASVVDDALANLDTEIERTAAEITVSPLPRALIDRSLAVLIVQNLVGNALKYAGDGPPRVRIACDSADDWVIVEVADEGEGMDPGALDEIFAPFVRLKQGSHAPSGTGIGLALVKKAVSVHGGDIEVESTPGVGSAFRFSLPAAR